MLDRRSRAARALLRLLVVSMLAAGTLIVSAPEAHAAACWDTGCDYQDPQYTGCSQDAYTLKSVSIPMYYPPTGQYFSAGELEVRFSPSCQAQWTRIYAPSCVGTYVICPSDISIYRWAQGGYPEAYAPNPVYGEPYSWSPMVGAANAQATSYGCLFLLANPNLSSCVSTTA